MMDLLKLQAELARTALPSGFEQKQADYLRELILRKLPETYGLDVPEGRSVRPLADEVFCDTLGNLICRRKGPGKKLMIAAHMDVIGMMITYIDEQGYLRFAQIGGHLPARLIGETVRMESGVRGTIRADRDVSDEVYSAVAIGDLYIDIGAESREEAEKLAPVGSVCTFDAETAAICGGRMMTPYADDLTGCIAMLLALEELEADGKPCENDLYFVFSTQEEFDSGVRAAAYRIEPDLGVAVDVTFTDDSPARKELRPNNVRLGGGPALTHMDGGIIANRQAVEHIEQAAEQGGIPLQHEVLEDGATDAYSIQHSRCGVLTSGVSIPCRNMHSPAEIVELEDIRQTAKLLAAIARKPIL